MRDTTSSKKLAKKARQIFRKNQTEFWKAGLKPKPRWVPWFAWMFLMKLVLKIEDTEKR